MPRHVLFDRELPSSWSVTTVDAVKADEKSACVAGPFGSNISSKYFASEGVPVIRGSNLTDDLMRFVPKNFVFVSPERAASYRAQHVRPGDLVFTCWGTVGQVGLIPRNGPFPEYIISNKQLKLRPNLAVTDPLYLFYYFASPQMVAHVRNRAIGAAVPGINLGILKSLEVVLPPLHEQRRIAAVLSAYDELIENNTRRIAILEEMGRRIYEEWFVRFRFPGHLNVRMVESDRESIPEGWIELKLTDVASELTRGPALKYVENGGIPVLNQRCIRNGEIDLEAIQFADTLKGSKSHLYLQPRDILINSMGVGTLGRVSRNLSVSEKMIVHNCITLIRSEAAVCPQTYLFYVLAERQSVFESLSIGTTGQTSLPITYLQQLAVRIPTVELLSMFDDLVGVLWDEIGLLTRSTRNLSITRDLLLPKLISGELDVSKLPDPEAAAA